MLILKSELDAQTTLCSISGEGSLGTDTTFESTKEREHTGFSCSKKEWHHHTSILLIEVFHWLVPRMSMALDSLGKVVVGADSSSSSSPYLIIYLLSLFIRSLRTKARMMSGADSPNSLVKTMSPWISITSFVNHCHAFGRMGDNLHMKRARFRRSFLVCLRSKMAPFSNLRLRSKLAPREQTSSSEILDPLGNYKASLFCWD